jgi:hypothetical protein
LRQLNHIHIFNEVASDFDGTEPQRQSLDEYLMDDSINRIMEHVLRFKPNNDFHDKYPSLAQSMFSEPYPIMARQMLGYPEPDVLSENDSDIEFLGTSNDNMPAATQP